MPPSSCTSVCVISEWKPDFFLSVWIQFYLHISTSVNCHYAGNIFALFSIFAKFQDTFLNLGIFCKLPPANSHFMAFTLYSHKVVLLPHRAQGGPQCWEQTFVPLIFWGLWIDHNPSLPLQCACAGEKPIEFSEADETHGNAFVQKFSFMK